jgi:2-keto-4-pentenoate hydratase
MLLFAALLWRDFDRESAGSSLAGLAALANALAVDGGCLRHGAVHLFI